MANEVLSDRELKDAFTANHIGSGWQTVALRNVEAAVVAALAARVPVDVADLAAKACADVPCFCERVSDDEWDNRLCAAHGRDPVVDAVADAIRLAIAQTVAKYEAEIASLDESRVALVAEHEAREAKWRELRGLEVFAFRPYSQGDAARRTELRRELGLEDVN